MHYNILCDDSMILFRSEQQKQGIISRYGTFLSLFPKQRHFLLLTFCFRNHSHSLLHYRCIETTTHHHCFCRPITSIVTRLAALDCYARDCYVLLSYLLLSHRHFVDNSITVALLLQIYASRYSGNRGIGILLKPRLGGQGPIQQ